MEKIPLPLSIINQKKMASRHKSDFLVGWAAEVGAKVYNGSRIAQQLLPPPSHARRSEFWGTRGGIASFVPSFVEGEGERGSTCGHRKRNFPAA